MTYRLSKLAAGSYDVILDGVTIASLVRTDIRRQVKWSAINGGVALTGHCRVEQENPVSNQLRPTFGPASAAQSASLRCRYVVMTVALGVANDQTQSRLPN